MPELFTQISSGSESGTEKISLHFQNNKTNLHIPSLLSPSEVISEDMAMNQMTISSNPAAKHPIGQFEDKKIFTELLVDRSNINEYIDMTERDPQKGQGVLRGLFRHGWNRIFGRKKVFENEVDHSDEIYRGFCEMSRQNYKQNGLE